MADLDVFSGDAFSAVELTDALEEVPYQPQYLGSLNLFAPRPVRTTTIAIEKRENTLALVQTTPRGAPLPQAGQSARTMRDFRTVRVAKGDRLTAGELQNVRAFGTNTELEQVQVETLNRMTALRNDLELTHENLRLGAVQGILLDADGSEIINWFDEWGVNQAAEIDFDLDNASPAAGAVLTLCHQVRRTMQRQAKGVWTTGTRVGALCGDTFFDQLISHSEVRATYLNWQAAADLRVNKDFAEFTFGGITWINYRGTDDNSTVAVPLTKAKFFPIGAPGAFVRANSPGESLDFVNTPGREFYPMIVPDRDRNMWVDVEVYSYVLYICTRPAMLLRAKNT